MHCYTIRAAKAALQIFTLSNSFLSKFDEWFCNDWYWIDLGNYFDGQWRTQNERKWQQLIYYQCNKGLNNGAARTNKLASLEAVQVRSCNLTAQWHRRGKWRATSAAKNGDDSVIWSGVRKVTVGFMHFRCYCSLVDQRPAKFYKVTNSLGFSLRQRCIL